MRAVGLGPWLALAGLEAAYFAALGSAAAVLLRRRGGAWWFGAAWVAVETIRSDWPFSGMPWGRLSYAVAGTPWQDALRLRRDGRPVLPAGRAGRAAGPAGHGSGASAGRAGRGRGRGGEPAPGARAVHRPDDRPADRRGGPGRRPRRRHRHPARPPAGDAQPRRRHGAPGRGRGGGGAAGAGLRRLAGELDRGRSLPRQRGQLRHPAGQRGGAGPAAGRRDGRRRDRARPQPGHRLGARHRCDGPLHEVAPGAVRRVHPVAGPRDRQLRAAAADPARHARRHPHRAARRRRHPRRRRHLLRRRLRRRDPRAAAGRGADPHRPDQQRDVRPDLADRAAVRDLAAAGAGDRTLRPRGGDQRGLRGDRTRRPRRGPRRHPHPGRAARGGRAGRGADPRSTAGSVAGPARRGGHAWSGCCWGCSRILGGSGARAGRREQPSVNGSRQEAPRQGLHGGADLQRGRQPGLGGRTPARGAARRRRARRRRRLARRHR